MALFEIAPVKGGQSILKKEAKFPRVNPANYWFNRQTQPTDSMEEEEEEEKVSEDDSSTDELEEKADSSEENN